MFRTSFRNPCLRCIHIISYYSYIEMQGMANIIYAHSGKHFEWDRSKVNSSMSRVPMVLSKLKVRTYSGCSRFQDWDGSCLAVQIELLSVSKHPKKRPVQGDRVTLTYIVKSDLMIVDWWFLTWGILYTSKSSILGLFSIM